MTNDNAAPATPGEAGPKTRRIRYFGSPFACDGYGAEARAAISCLRRTGYDLTLVRSGRDCGCLRAVEEPERVFLAALVERETRAPANPALEIHHVPAHLFQTDPVVPVKVARTMVEADRLRDDWIQFCEPMREIWVPSTFNAEVFGRSGIAPARLRVVPIGVDTGVFRPPAVAPGAAGRPVRTGGFKFLSVLTWQWRKGWDLLLEAYLSEFEPDERVRLVLKTPPPRRHPERAIAALGEFIENRLGRNPERSPPVFLIQEPMTDRELASLYAACDAFVLPSRGEGWGRPYLEAMATGLPAIGTGWGGNLDFMDKANSYLIAVEELEPVGQHATRVISASANWARPSVGHLRQLMRHVFSRPPEAQARAARARRDAVSRWDLAVTGRLLVAEVEGVLAS